jgi:hypothetical protein
MERRGKNRVYKTDIVFSHQRTYKPFKQKKYYREDLRRLNSWP